MLLSRGAVVLLSPCHVVLLSPWHVCFECCCHVVLLSPCHVCFGCCHHVSRCVVVTLCFECCCHVVLLSNVFTWVIAVLDATLCSAGSPGRIEIGWRNFLLLLLADRLLGIWNQFCLTFFSTFLCAVLGKNWKFSIFLTLLGIRMHGKGCARFKKLSCESRFKRGCHLLTFLASILCVSACVCVSIGKFSIWHATRTHTHGDRPKKRSKWQPCFRVYYRLHP